ncbi:hypothetical protein Bra3105_05930 [Brachybacterium halotolerans subsp. kimchii]|uniref:hypothetical protein n=1 Tax=Brachybacterium halotolerans TaxID=2795215 RepID=UPI001E2F91D6|nr:hypothetical protein [Brachybacterium halotolerans]UEJ83851.1 hypothetical protein Bra3105_05930 [Brachybacterium halotolerans subsp. kimchii]
MSPKATRVSHRAGLGRPLRTVHQAWPLWWWLLWIGILVVILGAVSVNPNLGAGTKVAGASAPVLATLVAGWLLSDKRLVVCEGGLLIGGFFPFRLPFAIRWQEIEPRGVTSVSDIGRLASVTGRSQGSTLFLLPQSRAGILLDGPLAPRARLRGDGSIGAFDTAPDTVRGGKLWAFAHRMPPEQLVHLLTERLSAASVPHAASLPDAALPPRSIARGGRINGLARD